MVTPLLSAKKGSDFMATSTFYDNIVLEREAAEKFAALLREPPLPRKRAKVKFVGMSDRKLKRMLKNLKK